MSDEPFFEVIPKSDDPAEVEKAKIIEKYVNWLAEDDPTTKAAIQVAKDRAQKRIMNLILYGTEEPPSA